MKPVSIDVAAELARLEGLTNFELRAEWRRLHGMQPPKSLSRDFLLRGITYKIQEKAIGGLSKSVLRKLTGGNPSSAQHRSPAPRTVVKAGTRLVREWNGDTYGPCPCRRYRVARQAIQVTVNRRARDHRRTLVGTAFLWTDLEEGGGSWLTLISMWPDVSLPL